MLGWALNLDFAGGGAVSHATDVTVMSLSATSIAARASTSGKSAAGVSPRADLTTLSLGGYPQAQRNNAIKGGAPTGTEGDVIMWKVIGGIVYEVTRWED